MIQIIFVSIVCFAFGAILGLSSRKQECKCESCECKPEEEKKDKVCDGDCGCNKDF